MQNFSLTEGGTEPREHLIVAYEEGIFRVKLTAYGTTMDGRDFILDVPEYSFVAEGPPEPEVEDPLVNGDDPIVDGSAPLPSIDTTQQTMAAQKVDTGEEGMADETLTLILVIVNGSIVLIGGIAAAVIITLRKRAAKPKQTDSTPKPASQTTDADLTMEAEPKGLSKLFSLFKKGDKPKRSN